MPWPPQTRLQCLRQALEIEQISAQKGRILQSAIRTANIGKEKQKEKKRNTEILGTPFIIGKTVISLKNGTLRKQGEKGKIIKIYTDRQGKERLFVNFNQCGDQGIPISTKKISLRILENDSETWWQKRYKNMSKIKQKTKEFWADYFEKKEKRELICIKIKTKNCKPLQDIKHSQKLVKTYQKRIDELMKENADMKNKNIIISKTKEKYHNKLCRIRNLVLDDPYRGRMRDIRHELYQI